MILAFCSLTYCQRWWWPIHGWQCNERILPRRPAAFHDSSAVLQWWRGQLSTVSVGRIAEWFPRTTSPPPPPPPFPLALAHSIVRLKQQNFDSSSITNIYLWHKDRAEQSLENHRRGCLIQSNLARRTVESLVNKHGHVGNKQNWFRLLAVRFATRYWFELFGYASWKL